MAVETVPIGTNVVMEAIPTFGYRFDNWSGDLYSSERIIHVNLDNITYVTANFSRIVPNWLIATIVAAVAVPLLLWWRRKHLKQSLTNLNSQDNGAL